MLRFVENGELFAEIQRRKTFSEQDAANILSQLLSAVAYCHERSIVHRDLKPENILVDSITGTELKIKVIDFGTAQAFSGGLKMEQTLGTSYYIAPEVLQHSYTEKCDVWSCGVILYILLCGFPPFNARTEPEILRAVARAKFSYQRKLPPPVTPRHTAKDGANVLRPDMEGHQF